MSSKKSKSKSLKSSTNGNGASNNKNVTNNDNQTTSERPNYNYDSYSISSSSQTSLKGGFSTLVGGFGGYHGTASSTTFSFDQSQQLDPQIEFCLKRLLKKDSITKLKAFADLSKLFATLSIDKLEACASAWAYAFNKLALVNDKRIRENLHLCFAPFCKQIATSKVKWFTPHLKRIFCYWFIHQHDTSPEVVEAAYNSFYNAFGTNSNRHWKVISYVKHCMLNEMQYILDTNTTPQTLSNHIKKTNTKKQKQKHKKSSSSKQDTERYQRVIASTLCGLATLIAKENEIESTNINKIKQQEDWFQTYRQLLCNTNIWRFINDPCPLLRNSAYLLCSACLGNGNVAKHILPLISSTLFRCMSDSYMPNMDNLWTSLLAMIQYKDCWKYAKKKSFITRLSNIVRVDIFTACKYIRSFLLYIPSNYLFELSLGLNTGHDNEDDDGMKKKKKKSKKNRHKHNDENDGLYPICKVLKCIWLGALNLSHLSKRFKAVTIIYFKLILQILLRDNNAKCDDNEYIHNKDKDKDMININKLCKDMIIKENVIDLICKSLKELDCPSLFFELLGEHFLPKIVEYDDELLRDYSYDMPHDEMDKIVAKMEVIRQNEYYNNIIVETVNCIFSSIQSEFIEPFGDLMTLVMDEKVTDDDEQQEIADKTDDFVSDYNTGLNKLSSFVLHLKPFICIENILYRANDAEADEDDDDSDDNITYWNRQTSVKFCLYELMNEIWNFQSNIELIVDMTDPQIIIAPDENNHDNDNNNNMIDSDSEIEDDGVEYDDDIKIDFNKLFVSNPNAMSYSVCNTSLKIVKNMIEILSIDFGQMSSNKFKLDLFLHNEITQTIQYILLQSKIPMQYSSGIMQILLQIINLILNQDKNNPMPYKYDTTKHWKSFLQSIAMTNYDWSLKNMSLFIDNILFENIESNNKEYGLESFLIDWLSQYLNSNLPNISNTIPAEAYTSLIISLQKLLSQADNTYLLPILKIICNYLDQCIANNPENKASYPGITKNKTHCIIRSLSRFLEQNWRNNTDENKMDGNKELEYNKLSEYQLLIVSKLFTLCFARNDRDDPQNIATICEYMFKNIIRYHTTDLYGELLEVIAKSLRLPFYFTLNPMNTNKDIPKYYNPSFIKQEIPIIINRYNPSRWRWCVQCLLLLQSTTFQHGLHLINIILSRKDLEYIFSLALCDKSEKSEQSLNKLSAFGVTLSTLQRCRDVICDLSDLIGMELVLYKPSENSHFSELSLQEIELCDRQWLICWLLSFEEKLSWLPVSTLPDPSIIQHTKQCSTESVRHLFAKPRIFSCVLYSKLIMQMPLQYEKSIKNERNPQQTFKHKKIFVIPQTFVDNIIMHAADPNNSSLYFKQCPVDIRSRVIGYFVNVLNDRMSIYNYHAVRYLDNGLRSFVSSLFTNHSKDKDIQTIIDNIQTMQSVFVMFPDFIPISFIRFIIAESTKCREKISNLTGHADGKQIIKELRLLHHLLRPIHCIALNITCEYKTPSYHTENICNKTSTNYPTSIIWDKHRELLVGTLFELFLYINGSFESYLQQTEEKEEIEENNDIYFWFSSCLTVISHALIGMNSEGEKDVFFELDWSSFIFVSNFVMNHILHERSEFTLCLHSYLSQFYQFLLIYSKPNINHNANNANNENDITILNNIDEEYRYTMMAVWHCMAVLRQIALRSTDLSGRKNLKTKKNKSFIFESLELLTEILGNEIWRNILSSEALASPFHKLSLKELGVEQSISSQTQSQFMLHSGFMAKSLFGIEEPQNEISYVNMTPSYQIHAILDELYHSINDLLNHPIIMSVNNKLNINKSLASILETWHYQLFDALGSSHHQIVASAFRILSISTPFHVLQNIHLFKQSAIKDDLKQNEYSDSDSDSDVDDDEVSVISSTSYAASVAFSMSDQYANNKNKNKNKRIHSIINRIIPIMYLLPHKTRSLTASHELRSYFLSWYLFMNMIEQCPLEFRLEIVSVMKHDNKYTSPLGSYSLALREIIEHVYIAPSLQLLMDDFINKFCIMGSPNKFPFDLDDFCSNVPSDDPNICANMLSRCKWLHNNGLNGICNAEMKHNTNIFFSNLAIRVYDRLLSYFPALCRYWAINDVKDRVTRNIVSKITSSQFSPIILKNIFNTNKLNRTLKILRQENDIKLADDIILKLKCNLQTREIEAIYLCQEISISVIILYPFDYPLKGLSFHWKQTCGLPPKKIKNWQMLLMAMCNKQNATIVEAFLLLSINISKHYQGIDECPICYSVVHPTKKTLPKVKCLTCKGKFHRYCIYKWTKTSQKSTCPLCRSLI